MNLQLDTTVSFHKILQRFDDPILELYEQLRKGASSVHASTFTKKEFAFSLISDLCGLQAHLFNNRSFVKAYRWIEKYSWFRRRFGFRIHEMLAFFILEHYGSEVLDCDLATKDKILANRLFDYLHSTIPEYWERFDEDLNLPLDDDTKCPFARIGPTEEIRLFTLKRKSTQHPCNGSEGCTLVNLLSDKDIEQRGISLLQVLQKMSDNDPNKTNELNKIQDFLNRFYEKREKNSCYEMCNGGIGDMIIAMETLQTRTLITTNYKEFSLICPVIHPEWKLLSL